MPDLEGIRSEIINLASQDSGGDFQTMTDAAINRVYRRLLNIVSADEQRRTFTLTTVSGTSQYGMPLYVKEVLNIEDPVNDKRIFDISYRQFDIDWPGTTSSGDPIRAYPVGRFGTEKFPASDGVLSLVSDSALDTGSNFLVQITGFDTTDLEVTESVQMNGTTAVNTTNSYDSTLGVERITKRPSAGISFTGNVTVKDDDSNTISVIPVWVTSPSYIHYRFHPAPGSAITYNVRAKMRKPELTEDSSWPEIDEDFHDLLVSGPFQELAPLVGKRELGRVYAAQYKDRVEEFKGEQGRAPARVRTFRSVQDVAFGRERPHRPLIEGVDF